MRITERKEVTRVEVEEVIVGRKCDICGSEIKKHKEYGYNYFVIHTWHHDWGNDSIESHEYRDACCPDCVMTFTKDYINESYETVSNTREIEIEHVQSLEQGASNTYSLF